MLLRGHWPRTRWVKALTRYAGEMWQVRAAQVSARKSRGERTPMLKPMAGWDFPFEVDADDENLARQCFRVVRRTCARFHVRMQYYEDRRTVARIRFVIQFTGRPHMLGAAVRDLFLELRAVSLLQNERRKKRLPLRLLEWLVVSGGDLPFDEQIDGALVTDAARPHVVKALTDYAHAEGLYLSRELPAPEFLEAQHSLIVGLCLALAPAASSEDSYPALLEKISIDSRPDYWPGVGEATLKERLRSLGTVRNKVKHRGKRHLAALAVDDHIGTVSRFVSQTTGVFITPTSALLRTFREDPGIVYRTSTVYPTWGEPVRFGRY